MSSGCKTVLKELRENAKRMDTQPSWQSEVRLIITLHQFDSLYYGKLVGLTGSNVSFHIPIQYTP